MAKHGKKYKASTDTYDREAVFPLAGAVEMLKEMKRSAFDETVDLAFRLGIDPRQSDQNVRGAMALPHGTGKVQRIVVIASGEAADAAREAGADEVGMDDLLERIKGGWLEFDTMIATSDSMGEVRKLGKLLGPRGLMPNPKTGTITDDTAATVKAAKAGRIEYRNDKGGCIHVPIGKASFEDEALVENGRSVGHQLYRVRPPSAKGTYMISCTISLSMSPGIKVDPREFGKA